MKWSCLLVVCLMVYMTECNVTNCTHTTSYWRSTNPSEWPSTGSLCGVSWHTIIGIEPTKMTIQENVPWVVISHQFITTSLNVMSMGVYNDSVLRNSILVIQDSLEGSCGNLGQWSRGGNQQNKVLYDALDTLRVFDHENGCRDFPSLTTEDAFYFHHSPDLIVIPSSTGTNGTITMYSLLRDTFRDRQFILSGGVIACFIVIPLLMSTIAVIMYKRRLFFVNNHAMNAKVTHVS